MMGICIYFFSAAKKLRRAARPPEKWRAETDGSAHGPSEVVEFRMFAIYLLAIDLAWLWCHPLVCMNITAKY